MEAMDDVEDSLAASLAGMVATAEASMKHLIQRLICEPRDGDTKESDNTMEGFAYRSEWIPFAEWIMNESRMDWQKDQIPLWLLKTDRFPGDARHHFKFIDDAIHCRDVVLLDGKLVLLERFVASSRAFVPLAAASWRQHATADLRQHLEEVTANLQIKGLHFLEHKAAFALWKSPAAVVLDALRLLLVSVDSIGFVSQATPLILEAVAYSGQMAIVGCVVGGAVIGCREAGMAFLSRPARLLKSPPRKKRRLFPE
jgi:hypothetical protein